MEFNEPVLFQIHLVNEDSKANFDMDAFGDQEATNRYWGLRKKYVPITASSDFLSSFLFWKIL